jgi:transcriptional regulator with XRE-family HTH domain
MNALEIKKFRDQYNITQKELAEIVGSSLRAVQSWEQSHRNIPQSAIKLIEKYKLDKKGNSDINGDDYIRSEVTPVPYDNYMYVEYADLSTSAGVLGVDNPAKLPTMKKRLIPREFEKGNYLVVKVDGDSMDNGTNISIPHGTEILIKEYPIHNGEKLPIRNNLFVIVTRSGTVFKQIVEHNTVEGFIKCRSYNHKYKEYDIDLSEVMQFFIYRKIVSSRPSIPEF